MNRIIIDQALFNKKAFPLLGHFRSDFPPLFEPFGRNMLATTRALILNGPPLSVALILNGPPLNTELILNGIPLSGALIQNQ